MSVYYGYKNRLWKQVNAFSFTGSPQQFTLQPGTYLLECCGALGGISKQQNSFRAYGGVSYGILSLEEAKTMYAYVGGNGEDVPDEQPTAGRGGWNGGGNGGLGSVGYYGGAGGGGASDIRLFTPNDAPDPPRYYPTIPAEYQQIEYIDTTGIDQYINTGFIPSKYTTIDFKTSFLDSETGDMCIFGARANGNRWDCWLSNCYQEYPFINSVYGNRTYNRNDDLLTGIQSGQSAVYKITPSTIYINNIERKTYSSSSGSPNASLPLYLLGSNDDGVYYQTYQFHGKLYHFRAQHSGPATQWTFLGSIQCSVNGRVYTTADVPQITCIAYGGGWHGPFVISKVNPGYALYSPYGEIHSFTYNGETYYHSSTGGWWGGETGGDDMGNVPRAPFVMPNVSDPTGFAQAMLDELYGMTPDPFSYDPNTVKDIELVPVKRLSDDAVGMYDTVSGNFYTGEISGTSFGAGPEGTYYIDDGVDTAAYKNAASILSRFIVAGGSGGSAGFDYVSNKSPNYANFGGGTNGGPLFATNGGTANETYASQTNGSSFGIGQAAVDRASGSYNDNGASGGGGGWYGGYAIQTSNTYGLAGPGGGGSGFVYTNTSNTPSGYLVDEDCQLTSACTFANKSTQSSIKIFEPVSEDSLEPGDIIKFISTGAMSSVTLNPGTYLLKCKGCDGSVRYDINDSPRGGYSEGVLTLAEPTELKAFVGGTGIGDNLLSSSYVRETFPDIAANGGGMPLTLGGGFTGHSGGAGSGATDFRIVSGGTDILPDGYTQLEYFRVSGTQYLDTDYILSTDDDVSIECAKYAADAGSWKSFGGSLISERNKDFSLWTTSNSRISMHRGSANDTGPSFSVAIGTKFTIGNVSNTLVVDGTIYATVTNTPYTCSVSFFLGCNHYPSTTGDYISNIQYHRFYIHNNGSLVVDMYPCIEMSTGTVGMYDIVRDHFYPGTGGLIAGPAVYGSASAFTRVIVAGGAGGCGGNVGGTGGGTTGGTPQGSSGTNEGPGTQTESPQSSSYYIVNGGFGYGGNGASTGNGYSTGVSGGAGGGGWYGGAGTYPSGSSDNQKGGAGGSGFVFTEDSVVPAEYLLSDIYCLEDARTVAAGNDSPIGLAEASIEVIDISSSYILCRDAEGIKGFNSETHEWEHIADELTPELFIEYGVYSFRSDDGLLDEYDILVNDADDISSILFDVVPAEQHVRYETVTPMTVDRIDFDTDYDRNLFDVNINVTRQPRGSATKIIIDVGINKRAETSKRAKVYSGIMMSK